MNPENMQSERPTPETDEEERNDNGETQPILEFARRLERERDEAREALSGRTVSCSQCNEAAKQMATMRDAIKEAHQAIKAVPIEYDSRFFRAGKWSEEALAKLQPFLQ